MFSFLFIVTFTFAVVNFILVLIHDKDETNY
jgi:hypothetical protein